jgi:hypothetical protein
MLHKILGHHNGHNEDYSLLGCDIMQVDVTYNIKWCHTPYYSLHSQETEIIIIIIVYYLHAEPTATKPIRHYYCIIIIIIIIISITL